jgi:hypothetical protein
MNYTTTKDSCVSGFIDSSIDNAPPGYFVCSVGEANPNTIRQYILTQG